MTDAARRELVEAYYRAIDAGDYDALAAVLTPGFTQLREDRTIEGRDAFVEYMREERPQTDSDHRIDASYVSSTDRDEVAVRGRFRRPDGSVAFGFMDRFTLADERLARLVTYTNRRVE